MSQYKFELYRPDLQTQVAQLQKYLWTSSLKLNTAYLEWKYARNPYTPEILIYIAMHGSRVVGMRGVFGMCWEVEGDPNPIVLPCSSDTLIEPGYRNLRLYRDLTDFRWAIAHGGTRYVSATRERLILVTPWGLPGRVAWNHDAQESHGEWETKLIQAVNKLKFSSMVQGARMPAGPWINVFSNSTRVKFPWARNLTPWLETTTGCNYGFDPATRRDGRIRCVWDRTISWRFRNSQRRVGFVLGSEQLDGSVCRTRGSLQ
jgi:hypothetical protein